MFVPSWTQQRACTGWSLQRGGCVWGGFLLLERAAAAVGGRVATLMPRCHYSFRRTNPGFAFPHGSHLALRTDLALGVFLAYDSPWFLFGGENWNRLEGRGSISAHAQGGLKPADISLGTRSSGVSRLLLAPTDPNLECGRNTDHSSSNKAAAVQNTALALQKAWPLKPFLAMRAAVLRIQGTCPGVKSHKLKCPRALHLPSAV